MRKFLLISALVLASATAQAGQTRGLILASNDTPNSGERIESVQPDQPKADASTPATEAAKPVAEASTPVTKVSRPAHKAHTDNYASEEARARRIAARYGVSW